jgi:hypothetical protein
MLHTKYKILYTILMPTKVDTIKVNTDKVTIDTATHPEMPKKTNSKIKDQTSKIYIPPHLSPSRHLLVVVLMLITFLIVTAGITAILLASTATTPAPAITNYEECVMENGGVTNLMYPPTCTTADGRTFIDESAPPVETPTPDPTADWMTYTDESGTYSFSLPANYLVETIGYNEPTYSLISNIQISNPNNDSILLEPTLKKYPDNSESFYDPNYFSMSLTIFEKASDTSLLDYIPKGYCEGGMLDLERCDKLIPFNYKPYSIVGENGLEGYINPFEGEYLQLALEKQGYVIAVALYGPDAELPSNYARQARDQILSTLEFNMTSQPTKCSYSKNQVLEGNPSTPSSNYRSYTNQVFKYTFDYPENWYVYDKGYEATMPTDRFKTIIISPCMLDSIYPGGTGPRTPSALHIMVSNHDMPSKNAYSNYPDMFIVSDVSVSSNAALKVIQTQENNSGEGTAPGIYYYFMKDNQLFQIYYLTSDLLPDVEAAITNILSTLTFLD